MDKVTNQEADVTERACQLCGVVGTGSRVLSMKVGGSRRVLWLCEACANQAVADKVVIDDTDAEPVGINPDALRPLLAVARICDHLLGELVEAYRPGLRPPEIVNVQAARSLIRSAIRKAERGGDEDGKCG